MSGTLFIISGPAGVGKGTVIKKALSQLDRIVYSVSCTTRAMRPGEREGFSYFFIGKRAFEDMVAKDMFLEWANVHGNFYGTRRDFVESTLSAGDDVILEIDVQGALQVKREMPGAVTVFIEPPSYEELKRRLEGRGTESPEELELRERNALKELAYAARYEHRIVNDRSDRAALKLIEVVKSYRGADK